MLSPQVKESSKRFNSEEQKFFWDHSDCTNQGSIQLRATQQPFFTSRSPAVLVGNLLMTLPRMRPWNSFSNLIVWSACILFDDPLRPCWIYWPYEVSLLKFPSQLVLTESFFGFWRALFLWKPASPEHCQCEGGRCSGGEGEGGGRGRGCRRGRTSGRGRGGRRGRKSRKSRRGSGERQKVQKPSNRTVEVLLSWGSRDLSNVSRVKTYIKY